MSVQADRERAALIAIISTLKDDAPSLSLSGLNHLVAEAVKSTDWVSHVRGGQSLDVRSTVDWAWASDVGGLIRDRLAEPADDALDHASALEGMTPQQRISYARKHGLG